MLAGEQTTGRFISVEGGEGAGKSTSLDHLAMRLEGAGLTVVRTREPGGTPLAEQIRALLLAGEDEPLRPMTELLLIFAARAQHLDQVIRPALSQGAWVLCDRFTDATFAYQGAARKLGAEPVRRLAELVHPGLWPDLTLYFDIDPVKGMERVRGRGTPDRFEQESMQFFTIVRDCYLARAAAEPHRFRVIDAGQSIARVRADLDLVLDRFLSIQVPPA